MTILRGIIPAIVKLRSSMCRFDSMWPNLLLCSRALNPLIMRSHRRLLLGDQNHAWREQDYFGGNPHWSGTQIGDALWPNKLEQQVHEARVRDRVAARWSHWGGVVCAHRVHRTQLKNDCIKERYIKERLHQIKERSGTVISKNSSVKERTYQRTIAILSKKRTY